MKYYRYAVRVEREVHSVDGRRWHQSVVGQSNVGLEDARVQGERKLATLPTPDKYPLEKPLGGSEYVPYGERPLAEEFLKEITDDSNRIVAVLTRNHYGSVVLNSAEVGFFDVDRIDSPVPTEGVLGQIASWWGGKKKKSVKPPRTDQLDGLLDKLREYSMDNFRVYQTAAGYRVLLLNRLVEPKDSLVESLFKDLSCDPLYCRLCLAQDCFRARLTPKPWRCGVKLPGSVFPRQSERAKQRFATWLQSYEKAIPRYAVCRFICDVGPDFQVRDLPSAVQVILSVHDAFTIRDGNCELA